MYITASDLTANGITGTPTYLSSLAERVGAIFNTLIGDDTGVLLQERTEEYGNVISGEYFQLRYANPRSITNINGDTIITNDYKIIGQKLYLKSPVNSSDTFPYLCSIVYQAGYGERNIADDGWVDIPQDIVQVCLSLAGYINNTKTSQGISSFRQDLLTVQYGAKEVQDYLESMGQTQIINKYKYFYAYSL